MNSKRTKYTRFLHSLSAIAGSGLVAFSAMAEDCYRVVDLGILGFVPTIDHIFALNNANQAVFTANVAGKKHAMVYLPVDAYNLTAGVHDLHNLAGADIPGDESVAHDINAAGIVVGWGKIGGERHAFVWRLDLPVHQFIDLGTFATGVWSEAWAISDDSPDPWIVGKGEIDADCGCDDQDPQNEPQTRGFALELMALPPDLTDAAELRRDPNITCQNNTAALDTNNGPQPMAVGFSLFAGAACGLNGPGRALYWANPTPPFPLAGNAMLELPSGLGSVARGISNVGAVSGSAITSVSQSHAVYWHTVGGPIVDLGSLLGAGEQSWGWRINNNAPSSGVIQVVGDTGTLGEGLLWECSGDCDLVASWSFTDLNDTISYCEDEWTIRQAHDVNDNGWIIGVGVSSGQHAVLLAPLEDCEVCCFADLDCSGNVGASDLLAILAAWGSCPPPPEACDADLDCDGVVGASDLLLLLAVWDECQMTVPTEIPKTVQDCFDRFYPDHMEALIACIEAIE